MTAVLQTLVSDLKSRWRPLVGLALLLGIVGGAVLTCATGARRTDTAFARLLTWANASTVQVVPGAPVPAFYQALRKLAGVKSVGEAVFDDAVPPSAHILSAPEVIAMSSADNSYGVSTDRVKILSGRMWRATEPRTIMVDEQLAAEYHLRPGSTFRLAFIPQGPESAEPGKAVVVASTVAAVVAFDNQIVPATSENAEPEVLLSPPFAHTQLAARATYGTEYAVQLEPGASLPRFTAAVTALGQAIPAVRQNGGAYVTPLGDQAAATQRAIRPQAVALGAFAVLAALLLLAVVGQLLNRQLLLDARDFPVLRALGMRPAQLAVLSLGRIVLVTLGGGVLAVVVAILASPLTPIGPARVAEPDPGFAVNIAFLGLGLALIVLTPLVLVLPTARRAATGPLGRAGAIWTAPAQSPSRLLLALTAGSVTRRTGVIMALRPGRGRTAVPVRSALVGTALAVAATAAVLVFDASFVHLLGTPAEYGQNWQQELDLGFGGIDRQDVQVIAAHLPGLTGYAAGSYGQLTVDGTVVPALGIDAMRGAGYLTMLTGHPPGGVNQIVLGTQTLRALHLRLGQRARVVVNASASGSDGGIAGRPREMLIVGTAVLAAFGQGGIVATDLGSGAIVRASVLDAATPSSGCNANCYNFVLARYRPTVPARTQRSEMAIVVHKLGCPFQGCQVISDQRPSDVRNYQTIRNTPLFLGVVLALLAIATLAHVLVTSVHRRRRDLAVLKVLGMDRAQILAVVGWQACAIGLVALTVGLPVGVLTGRWAWTLFAGSTGVPDDPVVSLVEVLAVIPVTLAVACLVAAIPGRAAARVRPAPALRAE